MSTYYVPKTSDTYSDVLLAWGLALVFSNVMENASVPDYDQIRIEDCGTHYLVRLPQKFDEAWVKFIKPKYSYYLAQSKENYARSHGANVIFLDEEYDRAKRQATQKTDTAELRELQANATAHRHLSHFGALTSLQADTVVNKIYELTPEAEGYKNLIQLLVQWFGTFEADSFDLSKALKAKGLPNKPLTKPSLLNPVQGKGDNQAKPTGANPDNIRALWVFEWLKLIGFFEAATAVSFKNASGKTSEYRVMVLVPRSIALRDHQAIYQKFASAFYAKSALKTDCLAGLSYAESFLNYLEEKPKDDITKILEMLEGRDLQNAVRGFLVAGFFKTSQFAYSVSKVSGFDLPPWIKLTDDPSGIFLYNQVIAEHRKCIRPLDEKRGEQVTLLERYRDWLSSGDLSTALDFFSRYAEHRMHCAGAGKPCSAFTTSNLEVIFLNDKRNELPLSPILENEGFRHIATAIRNGTINAQYRRKSKSLPSGIDVHFELSHDLRRNAPYRDKFVASLCDYLNLYNLENLRVSSRGENPGRKNVETKDIALVIGLIDEYQSSELICGLLLAYGYAKDPRENAPDDLPSNNSENTDDTGGEDNE